MTKEEFEEIDKSGISAPNDGFAKYFTGRSFLKPLTDSKKSEAQNRELLKNITFVRIKNLTTFFVPLYFNYDKQIYFWKAF